jgi:CHAD domain-containing protein
VDASRTQAAVRPQDPAGDLVCWALRRGERLVAEHAAGVASDVPDAVHQLRVACRRMRSDLRTSRALLDDPRVATLRDELSWLGSSAGAARDLEVLRERVRRAAGQDGAVLDATAVDAALAERQDAAQQALLVVLRSDRYAALQGLLQELAEGPRWSADAGRSCKEVLPAQVSRAWRLLRAAAGDLGPASDDAAWHRARIRAKRARYAAELAAVALGPDRRVRAARTAQDLLGEHQDAVVAAARLLDLGGSDSALALACGQLAERERVAASHARSVFLVARSRLRLG